jgi:hypothetical protein
MSPRWEVLVPGMICRTPLLPRGGREGALARLGRVGQIAPLLCLRLLKADAGYEEGAPPDSRLSDARPAPSPVLRRALAASVRFFRIGGSQTAGSGSALYGLPPRLLSRLLSFPTICRD